MARPFQYTPQQLVDLVSKYLDEYNTVHGHAVPSVVGLCKVLKIAKSTIYKRAGEDDSELSDILEQIQDHQHFELTDKGLKGEFNSAIAKLMLGKHGHHDKVDSTLSNPEGESFKTDSKWQVEFINATPES